MRPTGWWIGMRIGIGARSPDQIVGNDGDGEIVIADAPLASISRTYRDPARFVRSENVRWTVFDLS
jgi:hypothetical protein